MSKSSAHRHVPTYRLHKASGRAVVTLPPPPGSIGIRGRDVFLGQHGTDPSRVEYNRVIKEWQATGSNRPAAATPDATVTECVARYSPPYDHAERRCCGAPRFMPGTQRRRITHQ